MTTSKRPSKSKTPEVRVRLGECHKVSLLVDGQLKCLAPAHAVTEREQASGSEYCFQVRGRTAPCLECPLLNGRVTERSSFVVSDEPRSRLVTITPMAVPGVAKETAARYQCICEELSETLSVTLRKQARKANWTPNEQDYERIMSKVQVIFAGCELLADPKLSRDTGGQLLAEIRYACHQIEKTVLSAQGKE